MSDDMQTGGGTPLTPPPAPGSADRAVPEGAMTDAGTSARSEAQPRPARRTAITVTLAIAGGLALAGWGGTSAIASIYAQSTADVESWRTESVAGVTSLDVDVSAAEMRVEFADVDEARLTVEGHKRGPWTLERDGDELVVHSPDNWFGLWIPDWLTEGQSAVLTLPEELAGVDADFSLSAGDLTVAGDFGDLGVDVSAGAFRIEGSAGDVEAHVSAGRADLVLTDVETADLSTSAGKMVVELTGDAPSDVAIDVSAGSLVLTLPDEEYDVWDDASAGSIENDLRTSSDAPRRIVVEVSAGSAELRPGR